MARSNTASNANYLNFSGTPPVSAVPLTFSAWFNVVDVTNYYALVSIIFNAPVNDEYFTMGANAGRVYVEAASGGTYAGANSGLPSYLANTWTHGACTFTSTTSRSAYTNAGTAGTNTTLVRPTDLNRTQVGSYVKDSGTFNPINGSVAEVGIWNVALTADEIAMLADGYTPDQIRPASLVAYYPLIGRNSPETNLKEGFNLTVNGTMPATDHPPVRKRKHKTDYYFGDPPPAYSVLSVNASIPFVGGSWRQPPNGRR